ncbi:hypothetical protein GCM10011380_24110 [Sphingomonas metalli]|uniref:Ribonuclease VapC n=1 Tax=Sphingomonas metalli TaxID=1779358 RepID=A0A916WVQ9_9SPHN|nr:type II toxin-antitoxin system VapC family toxin [Sphingomonas metalli]GGB33811.1 hypothetical protein GCM10011380_24110 [Sphingomonas metalli]
MSWIIDASVALKWVVEEEGSDVAVTLLAGPIVAPDLVRTELANALWSKTRRGEIEALHAQAGLAEVEAILPVVPTTALTGRALQIALQLRHPVYDCIYLALAEALDMRLVTADRRLSAACQESPFAGRIAVLTDLQ